MPKNAIGAGREPAEANVNKWGIKLVKIRSARIVAVAASTALALAACGGDKPTVDPVTTPVSSRTTSAPSPSTTTASPTTASSTKATQEAAAIALVRTYISEYNKALKSGNTTAFRATFAKSCALCVGDAKRIDETFQKQQRLRGLQAAVTSLHVTLHDSRQIWVEGLLSQASGEVFAASGTAIQAYKPIAPFGFLWRVQPGPTPVIFGSEKA